MNYLLEGCSGALALGRASATLVQVPSPARFGLHKILVSGERHSSSAVKSAKDIAQATELLEYMLAAHPTEVEMAFDALDALGLAKRVREIAGRRIHPSSPILEFFHSRKTQ